MQSRWRAFALATLASAVLVLPVSSAFASGDSEGLHLISIAANGIAAFQTGGDTESGELSWTPTYWMNASLALRGNVGFSLFKSGLGSSFVMGDFEAMLGYQLMGPLMIEAGGGMQSWFSNGGFNPVASGNLVLNGKSRIFGLFDRVFAGYSRCFVSSLPANEVVLGVGIVM